MSDTIRFPMTQGDLLPELTCTLQNADDTPIDLTAASAVTFWMTDPAGASKITGAAVTIVDAPTGRVKYTWSGSNTDTPGEFRGEFRVTFPGSKPLTVPNDRYIQISIKPKLI